MTGWLRGGLAALCVLVVWLMVLGPASGETNGVAPNFQETTVFSGLDRPVAVRFASDGRVFVMEKNGTLKEFDSLTDTTPTTVYQFKTLVDDYWDRGPLGLALDPNFPANPFIYILYAYDAPIGGTAPVWNDACPTPPGATSDGCVISTRLSRLTISGNTATNEQVLINGWCQQYPSHSAGDLFFGADGALYVSGGDGASFDFADYGQGGGALTGTPTPRNPCGDPPGGVGGSMTAPSAEGGALRSQSPRRASGEPVLLSGALLRVDPATGNGLPDNPFASSTDANKRRIVAYGMRNPFRFTIRPGTNDIWIGDVGWNDWEEIDRQPSPTTSALNFGWPCYEGNAAQPGYQSAGLNLCTSLYSAGTATPPYYTYNHGASVVTGDGCSLANGAAITGLAFYNGGSYPSSFNGGLFFGDYSKGCIWVMKAGANGLPDPTKISVMDSGIDPVDLETGPGGDLFYADLNGGTIRRISYIGGNTPPVAVAAASPTTGQVPLTVNFDGSGSSDPDAGDTITYSWDLNGDGTYGDSTAQKPSFTYSTAGSYTVRLKVTDNHGVSTVSAPITINATSGGTATFGTTTAGASTDTATADLKEVSKYTSPSAVSVLKLTGYVSGLGAATGSQKVRAVIYADSSGSPGTLLGSSNEVVIPAGRAWAWTDFTFPSAVSVPAGTVWMGYIAGTTDELTQLRYDTTTSDLRYNVNPGGYAAGPANPFGSSITSNKHYSLYATYTTGGGGGNNPPTAVATGSPTSGQVPLTVNFDGSGSSDPDAGDTITYSWDLNGDGTYGDSTAQKPSFTYSTAGTYTVRLKVTDSHGASTTSAPITITATTGGGGTATFGTTTPGASVDTATADLKEVSKYTSPSAVSVVKLTGYVSGLGAASGSQNVRAVIYADSGGNPAALLGVSNVVSISAGKPWGWVDFPFPSAVSVPAGTVWMGYIAGSTSELTQLRYDSVTNELHYNFNAGGYAAGPTNPFGSSILSKAHYSLYATYTTGGGGNNPPVAVATASPTSGAAPLTVNFDGSGSSDPDAGDTITYSWDLNGDGTFGDSTAQKPSFTYSTAGTYTVRLTVTDNHFASTVSAPITITVTSGGPPPSGTFGVTPGGIGFLADAATADVKEVSKYTAPQAGNVSKLTGYISGLGAASGSQQVRAVIYADSSGSPGALLGVSNQVTVSAGQSWAWVDFAFPSPVAVPAGAVWMGYIQGATDGVTQLRYDTLSGDLRYNVNAGGYAAGATNPFGSATTGDKIYTLYATYAASGNGPPVPTIAGPSSTLTYKVGDTINFSGSATDPQDGTLPATGLSWTLIIHHCPSGQGCHIHTVQTFAGVSSGSFGAPDHDYPSFMELVLTATDSGGATASTSVMLQPKTVNLTFQTAPSGLQLTVGSSSATAPFTRTVIVGSANSISAPTPQTLSGTSYTFSSWSDGGGQTHNITAPATATTYTATYTSGGPPPPSTFGTTTIGASIDTATANVKEVSKYTSPAAVNVTKLTGYISGLGAASGSQPVRAVIYADNSGSPGALLGVSNQVTMNAGQAWAWVDFTFPSAVAVPAGTVWMGYIAGSLNELTQLRFDTLTGDMRYNANTGGYAAGATNPFGTATTSNKHYSLYATYS